MIEVYGVRLSLLPEKRAMFGGLESYFSPSWRERHRSIRDKRASHASLAGIMLLRYAGLEGAVSYDPNGRPYLEGSRVDFNITHTDRAVFCAVGYPEDFSIPSPMTTDVGGGADGSGMPSKQRLFEGVARVGLDAENLSRLATVRVFPLADRWFTENEQDVFLSDPNDRSFLRIWTRKESLVKWMGIGLAGLRDSDTVTAKAQYGVEFYEYREEDTVITLCTHAKGAICNHIHMLTRDEIEEMFQKY